MIFIRKVYKIKGIIRVQLKLINTPHPNLPPQGGKELDRSTLNVQKAPFGDVIKIHKI